MLNSHDFVIREVNPAADAAEIADIYRYYVEETTVSFEEKALSGSEMSRRIAGIYPRYPYFVAECGGVIAGYCYVHPWKERLCYRHTLETTVYLRHGMTSGGIGRALMLRLLDACRERGDVHALIACITTENEGSRRFHASLGFSEVSHFREVGCKFGNLLDVTDMEYEMTARP